MSSKAQTSGRNRAEGEAEGFGNFGDRRPWGGEEFLHQSLLKRLVGRTCNLPSPITMMVTDRQILGGKGEGAGMRTIQAGVEEALDR